MTTPVRVLVVEDHWVWADAVVHQIQSMPEAEVVGVATNAREALEQAESARPQIALVDRMLGEESGLRVARTLRGRFPGLRIVIVTVEPTALTVSEAREIGLAGFVSKDDLLTREAVRDVVVQVARGGTAFSERVIELELETAGVDRYGLSAQDIEIIRLLSRGLGTPEISRLMCLAPQTVRNRTSRIGAKLAVHGRLEIVAKAMEERIIAPPGSQSPEPGAAD